MPGRFVEHLAGRHRRMGFRVLGRWEEEAGAPPGWRGPAPDLYAERGSERLALLVEPRGGLRASGALYRARSALMNPGVRVGIYARSRRSARLARTFRAGLPADLAPRVRVHRQRPRRPRGRRAPGGLAALAAHWPVALLFLAVGLVLVALAQATDFFYLLGLYVWGSVRGILRTLGL